MATAANLTDRDRALFDAIAGKYAAKDLAAGSRHARRERLIRTFRRIPDMADCAVLEVGCGAGYAAQYLRGRYKSYLGIDHSAELIRFAEQTNAAPNAAFDAMDVNDLGAERQFDVIFMIGVLHHLEDAEGVLRRLKSNLRPGGWIVANEPQRGNPVIGAMRAVRKRIDPAYSADQREYSRGELVALYRAAGYGHVEAYTQGYASTPFAEVVLPVQSLSAAAARAAGALDRAVESTVTTSRLAWNVVVQGRA